MVLNFWVFEKKVFHICSTRNRFYSFQNFVIRLEKKPCLLTWSGPLKQCIVRNYPCIFSYMKLETREGVSPMGEARPYVWLSRQWRKRLPPRIASATGGTLQPVHCIAVGNGGLCFLAITFGGFHAKSDPLRKYLQNKPLCVNSF